MQQSFLGVIPAIMQALLGAGSDVLPAITDNNSAIAVIELSDRSVSWFCADADVEGAPAWSPDDQSLAFECLSEGNFDIVMLNLTAGERTNLTHSPNAERAPDWSGPAGRIAFVSDAEGKSRVFTMLPDGSDVRCVSCAFETDGYHDAPRWSPDGKKIAFTVSDFWADSIDIYVLDVESAQCLLKIGSGKYNEKPDWLPDGSGIIFSGCPYVQVQCLEETRSHTLFSDGGGLSLCGYDSVRPHPHNDLLACTIIDFSLFFDRYVHFDGTISQDHCSHIYTLDRVGDIQDVLTSAIPHGGRFGFVDPAWSHKGDRLVCVAACKELESASYAARFRDMRKLRSRKDIGWFLLGEGGDIIAPGKGTISTEESIYLVPGEDNQIELHLFGAETIGQVGFIGADGIVRFEGEKAKILAAKPEGFLWPFRDLNGAILPPPKNRTIVSPGGASKSELVPPLGAVAWFAATSEGLLVPGPAKDAPPPGALWLRRTSNGLEFVRAGKDEEPIIMIDNERHIQFKDEFRKRIGLEKVAVCMWPFVNAEGRPTGPPRGFTHFLGCTDSRTIIVDIERDYFAWATPGR